MKTLINISILLLFNINLVFGYQVYSTAQQRGGRIGYTTNYSNGNFTPTIYTSTNKQYNRNCNNQYATYKIGYTTNYSNGKFAPNMYQANPSTRRKIVVYNGLGDSINTPGGNKDDKGWKYKYDKSSNDWWGSDNGGITWKKWDSFWGWGLLGFTWREDRGDPTDSSTKWATDPNDPFLQPIDDGVIPLSLLMLAYLSYNQYRKKQRERKH